MSDFSVAGRAAFKRAAERAKATLRPGDRIALYGCGGGCSTVTFRCWTDGWGNPDPDSDSFSSISLDDLSPWNIVKVNGALVSFRDAAGEQAVTADNALRCATSVQRRRGMMRLAPPPSKGSTNAE